MITLKSVPNATDGTITEMHTLDIPSCCPVSKNPRPGSKLVIRYRPDGRSLEIASLYAYLHSFRGGLCDESGQLIVRDMEGMILKIADECRSVLGVNVDVVAELVVMPRQEMTLIVSK
jgi:hypothetical protein